MKEKTLKNIILFLMLTAKLLIIGLILFHYATQGLEKNETYSIITLILPLFMVYLTLIVKDLLSNPYKSTETNEKPKIVKGPITAITFIIYPIYFIALAYCINQTAKGELQGDDLQKILGFIESAFGVYIGQIIFTLFKQKEK